MTKTEKLIIRKIKNEQFVITTHALLRMSERNITDFDIIEAVTNLKSISRQDKNDTYLIIGKTAWGDTLCISAAMRDNVIVVTVYFEDKL